jgi:hypothetical protein
MATPTPNQLRHMLARVNADLPRETDPARACDLRILKTYIETAIALAKNERAPTTSDRRPPDVTIH